MVTANLNDEVSYPKSGTSSINYVIEKDDFSLQYITIDNASEAIQDFGQGCYMGKTDIESAFRLIPVHPDDWELLGMFWNGQHYFDKVLPFGFRSARTFLTNCPIPLSGGSQRIKSALSNFQSRSSTTLHD